MKVKALSTKFIISFIGALLLTLVVLISVFEISFRLSMDSYIKNNMFSMQKVLDDSVTEVVNEAAYLYARIVKSENAELLYDISDGENSPEFRQEQFEKLMDRAGVSADYFNDVTLLLDDFRLSLHGKVLVDDETCMSLKENANAMSFLGYVSESVVMGIYTHGSISDFSGIFLFYLDEARISEMCNSASGEGYSFIMGTDGYIISHFDKTLVGKSIVYSSVYNAESAPEYKIATIDGVKSIVIISKTESLNLRYRFNSYIISVLNYQYYFGGMERMVYILIGVSVGLFIVAGTLAVVRAKKISRPIRALSDNINSMEKTGEGKSSVLDSGDELKQLEKNYDAMLDRIFHLMEKSKSDMQLQRKLELDTLQMQINPHFLYNTLDAISWMAKIKKEPEIERLVMNLAKFFRLSLHKGDKFITVAEEIELVTRYLEIDKIRFPDRVKEHFEVDEEIYSCKTLKLVLQPLVENCLKYAFPEGNGNLWIRAYEKNDDLWFEVEDDGIGFEVSGDILTLKTEKDGGYGLVNVNERIKLQYGENYGLLVQSEIGKGTRIIARLKKEK